MLSVNGIGVAVATKNDLFSLFCMKNIVLETSYIKLTVDLHEVPID